MMSTIQLVHSFIWTTPMHATPLSTNTLWPLSPVVPYFLGRWSIHRRVASLCSITAHTPNKGVPRFDSFSTFTIWCPLSEKVIN
jgi:hypothetical protein